MFRLEVTADTLQQLYTDSTNLLVLIARGGQNIATQPAGAPRQETVEETRAQAGGTSITETVVTVEPNPPVAPKPERKPRTKPAPTIDVKPAPEKAAELPAPVDEDPLGLDTPAPEAKPELTLQNMRERVQAILEAGAARGTSYTDMVTYVRKLFAPFGIKTAGALAPEQFAEFWEKSQAYLDGTAA